MLTNFQTVLLCMSERSPLMLPLQESDSENFDWIKEHPEGHFSNHPWSLLKSSNSFSLPISPY